MGDKDLEKIISGIETEEKAVAQKQMESDRLREIVDKQKKLLQEQEKIIQEQNQKISSMFDVPADVEMLKRRIGELRSEINDKDHTIEMKYGEIAQLQQELKALSPQLDTMSKNFEQTYQQIGRLRGQLAEKEAMMKFNENAIHEKEIRIAELEKQIDILNSKVVESAEESKKKEILLGEKISDLKDQTTNLSLKQMEEVARIKDQIIEEYRQKEIQFKQQFIEERAKMKEDLLKQQAKIDVLQSFKDRNGDVVGFFEKLVPLLEKDSKYKLFLMVRDVGEMSLTDLAKAVGQPSVTVKKSIQDFIQAGILQFHEETGKVTLVKGVPTK